ncbi:MAG: efflux RND transporter periplasmic adaptor subunit [Candidatus Aegiribacteria sp.]|nr:efflux RND transporter periplasmic adaptor subunit [Candidatus Aegiribacteria sp.]
MKEITLGLVSVLMLIISCSQSEEMADNPIPVTVMVAESQVISSTVIAACRLESSSEAVITAMNPGRILAVTAREGDEVQEGAILVELSTDQQYSSAVSASSAQLTAARTAASNAQANLQRAGRLRLAGAISESEYEMTVAASAVSEANVRQALAGYVNASSMEESGKILAPFTGTVTRVWAKEGYLSSGPLVSIADGGVMKSELLISGRHLHYLAEGLPVVLTTSHYPSELFPGEVVSFSSFVDPLSGLVSVMVQFHDSSGRLRSGMTGTATIGLETSEDTVVLPLRVLLHKDDSSWEAALISNSIAEIVQVEIGIVNGTNFEITMGVEPGDSVILLGHHLVEHGSHVRVVQQ